MRGFLIGLALGLAAGGTIVYVLYYRIISAGKRLVDDAASLRNDIKKII